MDMTSFELEKTEAVKDIDWDEALNLYENLLTSGNEPLILRGTIKFARLANHAPEDILARSIPILVGFFRLHFNDDDSNGTICEAILLCLKRIACLGDGRLAKIIGQSGTIGLLLKQLQDPGRHPEKLILRCIRNIIKFGDDNCVILVEGGGLGVILDMLQDVYDDRRLLLLEIWSSLALLREVRRAIIRLEGLRFLVESVTCGKMSSRIRAAKAIGLLGLCKKVKRLLVDSGSIPVLVELLRQGDVQAKLEAANALGVITSHPDFFRTFDGVGAIPLFVDLIHGAHPMGREIAEDVLCVVAVVKENAVIILEHLVNIFRMGNDEAKCTAADVLWTISGYKHLSLIQNSGVIPVLVELLRHQNVKVRESVSEAVSQLSYNRDDRISLANEGAIEVLLELLRDESEELRDNAAEAIVSFSKDPVFVERVTEAFSLPVFWNMLQRMNRIRTPESDSGSSSSSDPDSDINLSSSAG